MLDADGIILKFTHSLTHLSLPFTPYMPTFFDAERRKKQEMLAVTIIFRNFAQN
jgi:hypothetical protein